jgi:cellulose synthase/poly-beta-1,6-N-acetylglucosamine synthase-like glycosyltransferase
MSVTELAKNIIIIIIIIINRIKTMWNIVKSTLNIKSNVPNISTIRANGNLSANAQITGEKFNNYFLSAVKICSVLAPIMKIP